MNWLKENRWVVFMELAGFVSLGLAVMYGTGLWEPRIENLAFLVYTGAALYFWNAASRERSRQRREERENRNG